MAGRSVLAALAAVMAAGCSGCDKQVGGCSGTAVTITATISPATATDGGTDADADSDADGGGDDAKPACAGRCLEYLEALRVAVEAATPASCQRLTYVTGLTCVPSGTGRCASSNSVDDARALQAQISAYLSASWPEIDTPVEIDDCACNFN